MSNYLVKPYGLTDNIKITLRFCLSGSLKTVSGGFITISGYLKALNTKNGSKNTSVLYFSGSLKIWLKRVAGKLPTLRIIKVLHNFVIHRLWHIAN